MWRPPTQLVKSVIIRLFSGIKMVKRGQCKIFAPNFVNNDYSLECFGDELP